MAETNHNFRFSEREIFERGEPTTQTGLKRLRKFRFTHIRFGNEKAHCPKRSSGKLNRFCPSGKSATRSARSRKSGLRSVIRCYVRIYFSFRPHAGIAGLAGGPTPSRMSGSGDRSTSHVAIENPLLALSKLRGEPLRYSLLKLGDDRCRPWPWRRAPARHGTE
jgi:hypothetical protein